MKKNGFTLIELLAVIVILAIIALIATPLVLKYIEKSRKESKVDSAYSFVRNLETEIANYSIKHNGKKYNGQPSDKGYYELTSFENSEIDTTVKGDKPNSIKVCLSSLGQVDKAMFEYGKYYVSYDGKKGSISDKDTYDNFSCSGSNDVITEEAGLYDSDGNLLYTWDELVNDYGINVEKDYWTEDDGFLSDQTDSPGYILAANEDLKNGTKLVIDSSVTKIGNWGLSGTDSDYKSNLVEIVIPDTVVSIGTAGLGMHPKLSKLKLPKTLTNISDNLLWANESLKKVEIPEGVVSIGQYAFSYCSSLEEILIPDKVTNIGVAAFLMCGNLKEISIPNKVINLDGMTFGYCTNLERIVIPKSVINIGASCFSECKNLKEFNYGGTEGEWGTITFGDNWNYGLPQDYKINYNYGIN